MKIGYARVSTTDQNMDLQLNALVDAGCDIIYRDHGISGVSTVRPGLSKAVRKLKSGDTLIVWRLDRLGRSLPSLIKTVSSLRKRKVEFRSLTEAIDTGTPAGNLVFHIFGAISEFERCLIAERSAAGIAAARARGQQLGRRPSLTTEQIEDVRRARFHQNLSIDVIAMKYSVHPRTVRRYLSRRAEEVF